MRSLVLSTVVGTSFMLLSAMGFAAAPADAPAGTTGLCKDGTYYSGATKKGACKGHKGVKDWYADAAAAPATAAPAPAKAPAAAAAPVTPPAAAKAPATPAATPAEKSAPKAAAPGGGPGQVWVNTSTKVYHCPGDKWYGKTKQGEYMSAADATAKGFKPDHGKACK